MNMNVFFKRLLPAVLALTAAALFVACDEDSDSRSGKSDRKTIVGHWHGGEKISFTGWTNFTMCSFSADGRYEYVSWLNGSISRYEGSYKLAGRELTEFNETPVAYTCIYMVEMADDASTLTLHYVDADGSTSKGPRTTYRRISEDEYNRIGARYE